MPVESARELESVKKPVSEFAGAFFDSAFERPVAIASQFLSGKQAPSAADVPAEHSLAAKAGHLAGATFDAVLIAAVAGKALGCFKGARNLDHMRITSANNPIIELSHKTTNYFRTMDADEAAMRAARGQGVERELLKEHLAHKVDFAHDMMKLWHGTRETPGIANFSDAQLATAELPIATVSQMRAALRLPAPELSKTLFEMTQHGRQYDDMVHDVSLGMLPAKEKFFDFDFHGIAQKMAMPVEHAERDHFFDTPVDWMPTAASSGVPGFYHGTVSTAVDSIVAEKSVLPSSVLESKGIAQPAGETAGAVLKKDEVSMTRDFSEAWLYQQRSPNHIDTYPIVFGISKDAASQARLAGGIEPGEILIDRLNFGRTNASNDGGVTHMYVPDGKVAEINQKLRKGKIKGVAVSGLNTLKTPEWTNEPPLSACESGRF